MFAINQSKFVVEIDFLTNSTRGYNQSQRGIANFQKYVKQGYNYVMCKLQMEAKSHKASV